MPAAFLHNRQRHILFCSFPDNYPAMYQILLLRLHSRTVQMCIRDSINSNENAEVSADLVDSSLYDIAYDVRRIGFQEMVNLHRCAETVAPVSYTHLDCAYNMIYMTKNDTGSDGER